MPIDKLNELICSIENDEELSPDMNSLLVRLREKQESLPPDADEDTVDEAVRSCLRAHIAASFFGADDPDAADAEDDTDAEEESFEDFLRSVLADLDLNEDEDADEDLDFDDLSELPPFDRRAALLRHGLRRSQQKERALAAALEDHFQQNDLHYTKSTHPAGRIIYTLGFNLKHCTIQLRLGIVDCSIIMDIQLPLSADPIYRDILCGELAAINSTMPFGAFICEEDGSLSVHYNLLTDGDFDETCFRLSLTGMTREVDEHIDHLRRLAAGRFGPARRKAIIDGLRRTLADMTGEA